MVAQADPQLIFQRIIKVAGRMTENIGGHFRYEMCGYPSSLFDTSGLFQEANKPILADSIWTAGRGAEMPTQLTQDEEGDVICHVLDGGSIIQRLPWKRDDTCKCICNSYVDYVNASTPTPIILFDGYEVGPFTKNVTHLRRSKGMVGVQANWDAFQSKE